MHRKLSYLGSYIPGRTNYLLLALQILLAIQGAARGMDYVMSRPPMPTPASLSTLEAALPLPVWGTGFLVAAGLVLTGLFSGRVNMIVVGHLLLAGLYSAFATGLLNEAPVYSLPLAVAGGIPMCLGIYWGISRWRKHDLIRFVNAMILTGVGGWVCGFGLGYDFRTATGLLIAGLAHAAFVIGTIFVNSRMPDGRGR